MPRRPRLTYFRAFEASARNLSFSLAAKELNLTQAAVSQQIKQLETSLGTPLFIRHHRSLSLSEMGKAYYQTVHEVLDRLDNVTDQLFPVSGKSIVSLHCTPSIATMWLAPRLNEFSKLHPDIEIHLRTTDILPDEFSVQGKDLEIVRLSAGATSTATMQKLWDAKIFPVCSPEFLKRNGPFSSPDQICGQELIHTLGYNNDWHRWAKRFAKPETQVNSGFRVDGLVISVEAACRGEGIILGRSPLIDDFLRDGRLVEALPGNLGLKTPYFLKTTSSAPKRRSAKVFADWITHEAHQ